MSEEKVPSPDPIVSSKSLTRLQVRVSGESPRAPDAPILPVSNLDVEKVEAKKSELLPPWIYVVSVSHLSQLAIF